MTIKEEKLLRATIREMLRESFFQNGLNMYEGEKEEKKSKKDEDDDEEDEEPKHKSHEDEEEEGENTRIDATHDEDTRIKNMRATVTSFLSDDHVNKAPYFRELWPDKKPETAERLGLKCLNNEKKPKEDGGGVYSFSTDEIVSLYSLFTSI